MEISKHAKIRSQQRGIPESITDLIVEFGDPIEAPGDAFKYEVTGRTINALNSHLKSLVHQVDKMKNKVVLVSQDGNIITIYHKKRARSVMQKHEAIQQFMQLYRKADPATKKKFLRSLDETLNKKESRDQRNGVFLETVKSNNTEAARTILSDGIDINVTDSLGNTALIYVAMNDNIPLVRLLLAYGANPHLKNNKGRSAMDAARDSMTIQLLLRKIP